MKVPDFEWFDARKPALLDQVRDAETALGIKFPADYLTLAIPYHGAFPTKNNRFVYRDARLGLVGTSLGQLLSFRPGLGSILSTKRNLASRIPEGIIPIAKDGGGDCVCLDYRRVSSEDQPRVVYWCNAKPFDEASIPLANSFADFIDLLSDQLPPLS